MATTKERIEELEKKEFFLEMKDRWTREDFETMRKIREEIRELKKQ